ncbi:sensor histidine kinase [Nonlabens antarcticus]|uniref:sensor histidine kinase n=1 Tax=Nonlabens antarcticus TaxID=392714 RepID=UPI0018914FB7|nr:HAMP domain-containing sensor histidine kinase [Nonlabens antarcticus]
MKTYHSLSKLSFLKKYSYKFLFIAFLGIHIPLLGLVFYALFATEISTSTFILITLGLTLGATALTLKILDSLLKPIILGKIALKNYVEQNIVPNLPHEYSDEVGEMLKNIQFTILRLDEINKEKEEVTELISHDLRTPIAQTLQIIGFLKENGERLQERQSNLDLLEEIASKQLKFLEDMLRILKTKQIEIGVKSFEALSAAALINEVIDNNKTALNQKGVKAINTLSESTMMYGHQIGLKQIFDILLSNAIKFSQESGEIYFKEKTSNQFLEITVEDSGVGFDESIEKVLFKKFVPGHLGTNGELSTGLGLYLAKRIVEKHNGLLEPFSDGKGKGASFKVSIPLEIQIDTSQ